MDRLFRPYLADKMRAYKVITEVGNIQNNEKARNRVLVFQVEIWS